MESTTVKSYERKARPRTSIPKDLPREDIIHDLPEDDKICPKDGAVLLAKYWDLKMISSEQRMFNKQLAGCY